MTVAVNVPFCEERDERVLSLLEHVCDAASAVAEDRLHFSKLHENIMQLERFIFDLDANQEWEKSILARLQPGTIVGVNDAYCVWQTRLEFEFAGRLVKGEVSLQEYALYERFAQLVRREQELLSIRRGDKLIFLGSGPLPLSEMLFYRQTGAQVNCVARDPGSAALARQVLEKCGLNESVKILDGTAMEQDFSHYRAVVMEALVRPKRNFLKLLRKRCQEGCRILCRSSHGLRGLLYGPVSDADFRGFYVSQQDIAGGTQTTSIFLLEAAKSAVGSAKLEWLRDIDMKMARQILQLMNCTLQEETTIGFPGPIEEKTGLVLMQQLGADVASGRRHVLVAEKDECIVGQLILTPNSSPNHQHIVELTRGTIHPSFRGGGLALRAFHEVARKCDELGREVICLDVRAGTLAAMWWQHFGFKPYGLLNDYSRVGDKRYEGLYLTQTTAQLKQRLNELMSMADASSIS
jgi:ribosomal protein S18 acetylase RimI-like enzyme